MCITGLDFEKKLRLKMLCLYLLGQNCLQKFLHLNQPYLSSETYSHKYDKLPNIIVICACKNITEKKC